MSGITAITMPKWGLTMEEGTVVKWAVKAGDLISQEQELVDIETTKLANIYESPVDGVLRRIVAAEGEVVPVGALIAVVAGQDVADEEIDAFIAESNRDVVRVAAGPVPETIALPGGQVTYLKVGPEDGEPVVFVHGFGSDHKGWVLNQSAISESHPTFALDLPGHGASYKRAEDLSANALADALLSFLSKLDLKNVHLVGHSLGAAVAALAAASNGSDIKSLTLIAPAGLGPNINGSFLDGFIAETRAKKLRPIIEMLVSEPGIISADMVEDVLKFKRLDGAQEALTAVRAANFPGSEQTVSIGPAIESLKIPVQVILGANDKVIPPAQTKELLSEKVIEVPGAGHIPHLEKAADVNQRIQAHIGT